jgi:hypothetical protein
MRDANIGHLIRREWDSPVSPDFNYAALTDNNLVKSSTVLESHRNYLIADARLGTEFQVTETLLGNRK